MRDGNNQDNILVGAAQNLVLGCLWPTLDKRAGTLSFWVPLLPWVGSRFMITSGGIKHLFNFLGFERAYVVVMK